MFGTRSARRLILSAATVVAVATGLAVAPIAVGTAVASDSTVASSVFAKVNADRTRPSLNVPKLGLNGYISDVAHEIVIDYANCPGCAFAAPSDLPSTPVAPTSWESVVAHVSTGAHTATRLLAALLTARRSAIENSDYNFGGIAIKTHGSQVYAVLFVVQYTSAPAGKIDLATPTITGHVRVGGKLTAHYSSSPKADLYTATWWSNGIQYATGKTFTIPTGLFGETITAHVEAEKNNYVERTLSSAQTKPVATGVFTVSGKAHMGEFLNVVLAPQLPVSVAPIPVTYSYRWYRNGHLLSDTNFYYSPLPSDWGKNITSKITLHAPHVTARTITTKAHIFKGLTFTDTYVPTITVPTLLAVDATITSSIPLWTPSTTWSITWRADGKKIKGEHTTSLKLTQAMFNKHITVTYTATNPIYKHTARTSAPTARVYNLL